MVHRPASFKSRNIALLAGLVVASILSGCSGDKALRDPAGDGNQQSSRPNIIFLLTAEQRWDADGYEGNYIIHSLNIDALAHDGVAFKNAYVTTPVCAISRASIFT